MDNFGALVGLTGDGKHTEAVMSPREPLAMRD